MIPDSSTDVIWNLSDVAGLQQGSGTLRWESTICNSTLICVSRVTGTLVVLRCSKVFETLESDPLLTSYVGGYDPLLNWGGDEWGMLNLDPHHVEWSSSSLPTTQFH